MNQPDEIEEKEAERNGSRSCMSDPIWEGITTSNTLHKAKAATRHRLNDAAKAYGWTTAP